MIQDLGRVRRRRGDEVCRHIRWGGNEESEAGGGAVEARAATVPGTRRAPYDDRAAFDVDAAALRVRLAGCVFTGVHGSRAVVLVSFFQDDGAGCTLMPSARVSYEDQPG